MYQKILLKIAASTSFLFEMESIVYWKQILSRSQDSINRRIFKAAVTVGVFTLILHSTIMLRDLVVAHQFGASDQVDAFLIAFLLPSFAVNVIAGSLNAALLPTYVQIKETQGKLAAHQLFTSVTAWSLFLLLGVSIILALSIQYIMPILASGFNAHKLALTQSLFFMLLPIIVISGIVTTWSSVLNAGEHFAIGALAPVMVPAVALIFLLFLGNAWGIYSLAVGTVSGSILQSIILAIALKQQNIPLLPRWYGMTPELRKVIKQCLPVIGGAFMMSSAMVVNQAMATLLAPGSVSALSYGSKITSLITGLANTALGTASLPYFAQLVAKGEFNSLKRTYYTYSKLVLCISIPITVIAVLFSKELIKLLFEHGAFNASASGVVAHVQQCYLLQVPFYLMGILSVRLITSISANHIIGWIGTFNFIFCLAGNYLLMRILGVAGIALSTSITYMASATISFLVVMRFFGKHSSIKSK